MLSWFNCDQIVYLVRACGWKFLRNRGVEFWYSVSPKITFYFVAIATLACSSVLGVVIIIEVECWGFGFKCIPKVGIWIWTRGFVQASQGLTQRPWETAFFYRPPSCPSQKQTDCQTFCRIITAERKRRERAVSARLWGTSTFLSL